MTEQDKATRRAAIAQRQRLVDVIDECLRAGELSAIEVANLQMIAAHFRTTIEILGEGEN